MSVLDKIWKRGGNRNELPQGASFRITEEGRSKLQDFAGDPKSRILMALEVHGSSDIEEITQHSGLTRGQVERLLPSLIPLRVQVLGGSMPGPMAEEEIQE